MESEIHPSVALRPTETTVAGGRNDCQTTTPSVQGYVGAIGPDAGNEDRTPATTGRPANNQATALNLRLPRPERVRAFRLRVRRARPFRPSCAAGPASL